MMAGSPYFASGSGNQLIPHSPMDVIRDVDWPHGIIRWCENYKILFGYHSDEGQTPVSGWTNHLHPADKSRVLNSMAAALDQKKPFWREEYRFITAGGKERVISDRCFITYSAELQPLRISSVMTDISGMYEALHNLQLREEQFQGLFDNATDPIVIHDQQGRILRVNKAGSDTTGYSLNELVNLNILDFLNPEDLVKEPLDIKALSDGHTSYKIRRIRLRSGHEKVVEACSRMQPDGNIQAILRDISDNDARIKTLEVSELRFRTLTENAPVGIFETDPAGNVTYVNEKILQYTGATRTELIGESWLHFIYPGYQEEVRRNWVSVIRNRTESTSVLRLLNRKWESVWVNARVTPVFTRDGELDGFLGSVIDITQEKLTANALRASEEKFRTLVDQASDGIFIANHLGVFVVTNRAACDMLQFTNEDFRHLRIPDVIHPDDLKLDPFNQDRLETNEIRLFKRRLLRKDGTYIHAEITVSYLPSLQYTVSIVRDMTDRIQAEELLKMSDERFRLISQATKDVVWDWDFITGTAWRNDNFYKIFGYEPENRIDDMEHWFDGIYPEDRERVRQSIDEAIQQQKNSWSAEFRFLKADGELVDVFDRGYILYDENAKPVRMVGAMTDFTELKKTEATLIEFNRRLTESEIMGKTGYWSWNRLNGKVDWSEGLFHLFGVAKENFEGTFHDFFKRVHPDDQGPLQNHVQHTEKAAGESVHHFRAYKDDGTLRYFVAQVDVRRDEQGQLISVFGNVRDETDSKLAELRIKAEKELSDSIVNSMPGIFLCLNKEGQFVRWNREFEVVSGYNAAEIRTMKAVDFSTSDEAQRLTGLLKQFLQTNGGMGEAVLLTKAGREIPYYFKCTLANFFGSPCLLGTGVDISDRKEALAKLEESYNDIRNLTRHLQHLREKERMNMAHEIQDEIGQQLSVLKMEMTAIRQEMSGSLQRGVRQKLGTLDHLLEQMMNRVRSLSASLWPSMLNDLGLTATMEWMAGDFEKHSGIHVSVELPDAEIVVDPELRNCIFRVFQETLFTQELHTGAGTMEVIMETDADEIRLTISDNGEGLMQAGTSIRDFPGLFGLQERARNLGGDYQICNLPEKGTLSILTLPLQNSLQTAAIH